MFGKLSASGIIYFSCWNSLLSGHQCRSSLDLVPIFKCDTWTQEFIPWSLAAQKLVNSTWEESFPTELKVFLEMFFLVDEVSGCRVWYLRSLSPWITLWQIVILKHGYFQYKQLGLYGIEVYVFFYQQWIKRSRH